MTLLVRFLFDNKVPAQVSAVREPSIGGTAEVTSLIRRIGSLFERSRLSVAERPTPEEVEELLLEGWAQALALEMEQARLERRIADLFAAGGNGTAGSPARKLRGLGARHLAGEQEIIRLRSVLEELRDYGESLKSS